MRGDHVRLCEGGLGHRTVLLDLLYGAELRKDIQEHPETFGTQGVTRKTDGERERDTERDTEKERGRERQREREREGEREIHRERERERERERCREREREKEMWGDIRQQMRCSSLPGQREVEDRDSWIMTWSCFPSERD